MAYSTQDELDLRDVPQLALPEISEAILREKDEKYHASYSFQQYLFHVLLGDGGVDGRDLGLANGLVKHPQQASVQPRPLRVRHQEAATAVIQQPGDLLPASIIITS